MDIPKVRNLLALGTPLNSINLKVTYYSRVSTESLLQQSSLLNQSEHIEEMIKKNPNWEYVTGYIDSGISGTTDYKRISFLKMIEDAKKGLFDLIITKEISRFSRNTLDSIKYSRELLSYGVAVYFINDNINTILPDAELRLTIMASLAQDEIRRLSERVKFGMLRSIHKGKILGNDLQYGYKKNHETGILTIIPEEASVVRRLYTYYAIDKLSLRSIASIFNEENIKTSLNRKWNITTLKRMLENPKYKGTYCGRKTEIIDYMSKKKVIKDKEEWIIFENSKNIPAIVDTNLWNLANERLLSRRNKGYVYQNRYLLSAKMICMNDFHVFHRKNKISNNDIVWSCSKSLNNGKKVCNSVLIRESEIIAILDDIITILDINLCEVLKILMNYYDETIKDTLVDTLNVHTIHIKLLSELLDKINIYTIDKTHAKLDIFLNYKINMEINKSYEFKRGENIKGTKRYKMYYIVNVNY